MNQNHLIAFNRQTQRAVLQVIGGGEKTPLAPSERGTSFWHAHGYPRVLSFKKKTQVHEIIADLHLLLHHKKEELKMLFDYWCSLTTPFCVLNAVLHPKKGFFENYDNVHPRERVMHVTRPPLFTFRGNR